MRELRNLNYISITADEVKSQDTVFKELSVTDFDISPDVQNNVYCLYLDCKCILVMNDVKYTIVMNLDLYTDNKNDYTANTLEDLSDFINVLQTEFFKVDSIFLACIYQEIASFNIFANRVISLND